MPNNSRILPRFWNLGENYREGRETENPLNMTPEQEEMNEHWTYVPTGGEQNVVEGGTIPTEDWQSIRLRYTQEAGIINSDWTVETLEDFQLRMDFTKDELVDYVLEYRQREKRLLEYLEDRKKNLEEYMEIHPRGSNMYFILNAKLAIVKELLRCIEEVWNG